MTEDDLVELCILHALREAGEAGLNEEEIADRVIWLLAGLVIDLLGEE